VIGALVSLALSRSGLPPGGVIGERRSPCTQNRRKLEAWPVLQGHFLGSPPSRFALDPRFGRDQDRDDTGVAVLRRALLTGGGLTVCGLIFPCSAWASTNSSAPPLPLDLWVTAAAGGGAALLVMAFAVLYTKPWDSDEHGDKHGWFAAVPAASAWTAQDSWVTNLTAAGATLTAIFSATAVASFVKGVNIDGFTVMSLLFGGAAVMGPVVYGAFAKEPSDGTDGPVGSRFGLMLASLVTLFAAFGLLADLGLLVSNSVAKEPDPVLVYIALGAAAVMISIYATRSAIAMVKAKPEAHRGGSLLSSAQRSSGTI
jgi:hypothetical protein